MKMGHKVLIDFQKAKTIDDLYDQLSDKLGFPDFFGRNGNALIDCLSSLRYPEDGMTSIHVKNDEYLLLELNEFYSVEKDIKEFFIICIDAVNKRCIGREQPPSIVLSLK